MFAIALADMKRIHVIYLSPKTYVVSGESKAGYISEKYLVFKPVSKTLLFGFL